MSTALQIPTFQDGFYSQKIVFDGTQLMLNFHYNARMDRWIVDIFDANGNNIIYGIPVVAEFPFTSRYVGRYDGLPLGKFFAIDMTGAHQEPNEINLGSDVLLFYLEP